MLLRSVFLKGLRDLRRSFPFWAIGVAIMPISLGLLYPSIEEGVRRRTALHREPCPRPSSPCSWGRRAISPRPWATWTPSSSRSWRRSSSSPSASRWVSGRSPGKRSGDAGPAALLSAEQSRLLLEKGGVLVVGLVAAHAGAVASAMVAGGPHRRHRSRPPHDPRGPRHAVPADAAVSAIAFAGGAATGNRGVAIGLGAIVALGSYLLNALAPLNETIAPLQKASLFFYYGGTQPLRSGVDAGSAAVLLVGDGGGVRRRRVVFARRDVHA